MSILLNDNVKINAGKPADYWRLDSSNNAWANIAAVNAGIPLSYRSLGLTVQLPIGEFWYKDGLADSDLIFKSNSVTLSVLRGNESPSVADNYYTTDFGKEGFWYYDPTDTTSTDNTGTILVSATGKRYKRVVDDNEILSSWFGWVSDGYSATPTDNQVMMQNWLTACSDKKGVVNIKGNYLHSDLLRTLGSLIVDMRVLLLLRL